MPHIKFTYPVGKPVFERKIDPLSYLQILFDDLGFDRLQRNDKLSEHFHRPIKFLDDLTPYQVKTMISILREEKYGKDKLQDNS